MGEPKLKVGLRRGSQRREQRLSGTWDHATHVLEPSGSQPLDSSSSLSSVDRNSLSRASTATPHLIDDRTVLAVQDDTALTSEASTSLREFRLGAPFIPLLLSPLRQGVVTTC